MNLPFLRIILICKSLFNKIAELDEIKFENVFVDGTKIEANANRYTFVWKKAIEKFEAKLQKKLTLLLNQ